MMSNRITDLFNNSFFKKKDIIINILKQFYVLG